MRSGEQIRCVLENGLLFQGERILARILPSERVLPPLAGKGPFLAVIISRKKAKRAVVRNRMKRQLREAFKRAGAAIPEKTACVVVAKRAEKKTEYAELANDLAEIIKKYRKKSEPKSTV